MECPKYHQCGLSPYEKKELLGLLPSVISQTEHLRRATPESIQQGLKKKYNVKSTQSQLAMVLENGCDLGILEVRNRYRLNPEITRALDDQVSTDEDDDKIEDIDEFMRDVKDERRRMLKQQRDEKMSNKKKKEIGTVPEKKELINKTRQERFKRSGCLCGKCHKT